jgi:hypothetical protein
MDAKVIIRLFARKICRRLSSQLTSLDLVVDIIELLASTPLFTWQSYAQPKFIRHFILKAVIKNAIRRKGLSGVNVNDLSRAIRLTIIDSSDEELKLVSDACVERVDKMFMGCRDCFIYWTGLLGAILFIIFSVSMDIFDFILRRNKRENH